MIALNLSHCRVLVVDDVRFTRVTLTKMLQQLGEPVVLEAPDGRAALELLEADANGVDCVITDVDMPRLDGVGLLRAIRAGVGRVPRHLPVIVLTGFSDLDRLEPTLLMDADAFLTKPASRQAIERCLAHVFSARDGRLGRATEQGLSGADMISGGAEGGGQPPSAASPGEQQVAISDIPADAVLARDLLFSNGRLLLRAGTRLTGRILERLQELKPLAGIADEAWIRT